MMNTEGHWMRKMQHIRHGLIEQPEPKDWNIRDSGK
jgi:hypothetical protein